MVVTVTSRSTKEEIDMAIKKLEQGSPKQRRRAKKGFDAANFCGVIELKEDPLVLQKKWRDEWQ